MAMPVILLDLLAGIPRLVTVERYENSCRSENALAEEILAVFGALPAVAVTVLTIWLLRLMQQRRRSETATSSRLRRTSAEKNVSCKNYLEALKMPISEA